MFEKWKVPIKADSFRSTELKELKLDGGGLRIMLVEEHSEELWELCFHSFQAFRLTTEECFLVKSGEFPCFDGFFRSNKSHWLQKLQDTNSELSLQSYHFIVFCYDEVVEVVAELESAEFSKLHKK